MPRVHGLHRTRQIRRAPREPKVPHAVCRRLSGYKSSGRGPPKIMSRPTRKQYVLVAAGAVHKPNWEGVSLPTIVPGCAVVVAPSSQAYWRGAPVPRVIVSKDGVPPDAPERGQSFLGILERPPVPAGVNFGEPLAVLTVTIQGDAELHEEQYDALRATVGASRKSGWLPYNGRRILMLPGNRIVLQ